MPVAPASRAKEGYQRPAVARSGKSLHFRAQNSPGEGIDSDKKADRRKQAWIGSVIS
jgi:hypothetical protein